MLQQRKNSYLSTLLSKFDLIRVFFDIPIPHTGLTGKGLFIVVMLLFPLIWNKLKFGRYFWDKDDKITKSISFRPFPL